MSSLGVSDVRRFPFLDAPPEEAIENALLELKQHVCNIEMNKAFDERDHF